MAAQSLYRKWRSQTFHELIGQEHVIQTLRNAIVEDRVAHAYLFTGPRGVGKTSVARLLAKAVNCYAAPAERPCGACAACIAISDGSAVDVIEMDAASHTSVEDAREIIERVQFRPSSARYKVYVIDECHMLSTAAFNALLKTLEEPPGHALFILATTEVHKVPATILSRCQRFTFTRHSATAAAAHLQRVATAESLILDPGVAEAIARSATGSLRDALGVLEQLASFGSGHIRLDQVHSLLGMTAAAEVNALIEALLANETGASLRAVASVAEQGADLRQFTRDLVERLRIVMLIAAGGDRDLLDVSDDELASYQVWASTTDVATLLHYVKLFSSLDYPLRTSPYGQLPLELAVVEALTHQPQAAPATPATPATPTTPARPTPPARPAPPRVTAPVTPVTASPPHPVTPVTPVTPAPTEESLPAMVPAQLPTAPVPVVISQEEALAANAEISQLERIEAIWPDVVRDVRPRDKMLQALLRDVRPVDVEGNTLILLANSPFHRSQIEKPINRQIIEEILSKHMTTPFGVRCTTEARAEARDLRSQIRAARKDPLIRAAINIFDADVIGIEPDE